ncbi:MAG: glycosyltransferase [Lachnospiraceae bacterium]
MLEKNFISAVLYLNKKREEKEFQIFFKQLVDTLTKNFAQFEIICVDDDAREESLSFIKEYKTTIETGSITILHMSYHQGIEVSMNAGRDLAIGDFVFEFDECIWNFPSNLLMELYDTCLKDCDIVCGADEKKGGFTSKVFYKIFNYYAGLEHNITSDNVRILSRRGINRMQSLNKTIPYRKALYANCGLKFKVITYQPTTKTTYSYNQSERTSRRALGIDSLLLFTDLGYRIAALMAGTMAVVMVLSAVYTLIIYAQGIAIEGWTTTMLFLTFAFFGLFLILSIVIKYLSLLLQLNFKKNKYLFESIEKLK